MSSTLDVQIHAAVESLVNDVRPSTPTAIHWPGTTFEIPATDWVAVDIDISEQQRITSTGTAAEGQETQGNLEVHYYAVKNTGWLAGKTYRAAIAAALNEGRFPIGGTNSYLEFEAPTYEEDDDDPVFNRYGILFLFRVYHNKE